MTKNHKICQTQKESVPWKIFVLKVTGVTSKPQKMTLDAETLCQKHPELTALIDSLGEDDNLSITISSIPRTQNSVSVSIESSWNQPNKRKEQPPVQLSLQL